MKHLKTLCLLLLSTSLIANPSHHIKETEADVIINQVYQSIKPYHTQSMVERIKTISAKFLGKPYILGALGEGLHSRYDQYPLYRTDGFDCETFVTTVLTLALADDLPVFKTCIRHLRYQQGKVAYIHRNHFTELDWNNNQQQMGLLEDITKTIVNQQQKPIYLIATATINRPAWIQHRPQSAIRLNRPNAKKSALRITELHQKAPLTKIEISTLPYLPFTALFNKNGQANLDIFKQIPDAAVIEIVRPNWNLKNAIGTNLNVSHLGFGIWKDGTLYFREASSVENKVIDIPLTTYLKDYLNSDTIKGINIQKIVLHNTVRTNRNCTVVR